MNNKPILMIHEVTESMLDRLSHHDLSKYTITFDDGLYSQYYYFDFFRKIPTQKIFFITAGIVSPGPQSTKFISCFEAHAKAKGSQNFEDYMTAANIRYLSEQENVEIGGHGFSHIDLNKLSSLYVQVKSIEEDTVQMLEWFVNQLGTKPSSFCYPYNNDVGGLYTSILKKHGFARFFGGERIPVERLLQQ